MDAGAGTITLPAGGAVGAMNASAESSNADHRAGGALSREGDGAATPKEPLAPESGGRGGGAGDTSEVTDLPGAAIADASAASKASFAADVYASHGGGCLAQPPASKADVDAMMATRAAADAAAVAAGNAENAAEIGYAGLGPGGWDGGVFVTSAGVGGAVLGREALEAMTELDEMEVQRQMAHARVRRITHVYDYHFGKFHNTANKRDFCIIDNDIYCSRTVLDQAGVPWPPERGMMMMVVRHNKLTLTLTWK